MLNCPCGEKPDCSLASRRAAFAPLCRLSGSIRVGFRLWHRLLLRCAAQDNGYAKPGFPGFEFKFLTTHSPSLDQEMPSLHVTLFLWFRPVIFKSQAALRITRVL